MSLRHAPRCCLSASLLIAGGCLADGNPVTFVAVTNHNRDPVTVTVTPLQGPAEVFSGVIADGTTPIRRLPIERFETVDVTCTSGGCLAGRLTLSFGVEHTIHVVAGEPPSLSYDPPPAPSVVSLSPSDEATDVALNASMVVRFSLPMDPATITAGPGCAGAVQLSQDDFTSCVPVGPVEPLDPRTYRVRPTAPLAPETAHALRVTTEARSVTGQWLEGPAVITFTTGAGGDEQAPAAVEDLTAQVSSATEVVLTWTAVGDDGRVGRADSYDVRAAAGRCPLLFDDADPAPGAPSPGPAGTTETMTISGLAPMTTYCFALRVDDEVPNRSATSNHVSVSTPVQSDDRPPAVPAVSALNPTPQTIDLRWRAVGDDGEVGRADRYELRFLAGACPTVEDGAFVTGNPVGGLRPPRPAGDLEEVVAAGLAPEVSYCFVLGVFDEAGNAAFSAPARQTTVAESGYW